ncbi:hypothetical protein KTAU_30780 [Thermogemmatispora aurantia]|uniref:serine/threonine-protein kinase n=1 Tax=Thermogemmatispora aurantia TaxID=2045279 RepID=UPI00124EB96D|nr:serine/threonine-protein kinase [Thermogemmatispora aurantia]GER84442.1 hypothetical protein KTAU_30780 [Thermogemmatispora aurantia]
MVAYSENPFASVGNSFGGDHFIGRSEALETIANRVIRPEQQRGSLAIIGLPQTGKTWLIARAFIEPEARQELLRRRLLPIQIKLTAYGNPLHFFYDLVACCKEELETLKLITPQIRTAARKILNRQSTELHWQMLRHFFRAVCEANVHVIFLIDRFDHARLLFADHTAQLQWFRELTGPDCQVTWVVQARRPLQAIESQPQTISDSMFLERRLAMFNESELPAYFDQLARAGVQLDEAQRAELLAYCGRHPYLLGLMGYQLVEHYGKHTAPVDVARAAHEVESRFHRYYDQVLTFLREDERQQKLEQLLFGPVYGLDQRDVDLLLSYGLIQPNPAWSAGGGREPAYVAFSLHFQTYLSTRLPAPALPPPLREAEQALSTIVTRLLKHYRRQTPLQYASHLSFRNMFPTIFQHWDIFRPYFSSRTHVDVVGYWRQAAALLMAMCEPLMQPTVDQSLYASYRDTDLLCNEILDIYQKLEEKEWLAEEETLALVQRTILPGEALSERYIVEEILGRTPASQVVKAWDPVSKCYFAIKLLHIPHDLNSEDIRRCTRLLQREGQIIANLYHRNICRFYHIMMNPPGIVMEWVEGKSLDQHWKAGEWLSPTEVIRLGMKLAQALDYVHTKERPVIHRDIKPQNIIIDREGEPVLIDFSIARSESVDTILWRREDGSIPFVGTPEYSSPEQLLHPERVETASDIFSLGVVLYQALTSGERLPYSEHFYAGHYRSPLPDPPRLTIPVALYEVLRGMLREDPAARPSAATVYEQLAQCSQALPFT